MTLSLKRFIDRVLLGLCRLTPSRIARHVLFLLRSHPSLGDGWGYHIRPIHYYEPLPDFRDIKEAVLLRRRVSPAIEYGVSEQLLLIRRLGAKYLGEITDLAAHKGSHGFDFHNPYFAELDAALYYALIRELKPACVIEIGSGYSTRIADIAIQRNRANGPDARLVCIEPYPESRLTEANLKMTLIQKHVQDVALEHFDSLDSGDVLFVDSSHAVKLGGDVCHEILEILPRLKAGVWIHVHDIFIPFEYPADWVIKERIAYTEQYLLEAFLAFNGTFSARAANYWLCREYPEAVESLYPRILSRTGRSSGNSFWMRKEA